MDLLQSMSRRDFCLIQKEEFEMVKHIVMFKLKEADGKSAMENAKEAQVRAEQLKGAIPSLEKIEAVCNAPQADKSNYELALICDFKDMEALNAYQTHPAHLKFGEFVSRIRESRACIDYEY